MPVTLIFMFIVFAVAVSIVYSAAKVLREDQRGLLFRLGKFIHVMRPGFHICMPFFDRVQVVNLKEWLPNWTSMSEESIEARLKEKYVSAINR